MTATPALSWSGPGRAVTTWRSVAVAAPVIALPVLCVVPLGSPALQVAVVGVVLLAAVVGAALPVTTRPSWRIDACGVTVQDGVGPARRVSADRYDTLAFGLTGSGGDQVGLLDTRAAAEPTVVHRAGLTNAGTAFSLCFVARHLGLALRLPPAAPARLEAAEHQIRDALATGDTVRPTAGAAAAAATFRDPPPPGVGRAVLIRLVTTAVGLALVLLLLAPDPGAPVRVFAALGTWLVLAALPGLFRVRSARPAVTWRIGAGQVDVVDTRDGRWRYATDEIGVGVVVTADTPGHGTAPRSAVLVVDRAGRPVGELPLRALSPSAVTASLHEHGVPTVVAGLAPWDLRGGLS